MDASDYIIEGEEVEYPEFEPSGFGRMIFTDKQFKNMLETDDEVLDKWMEFHIQHDPTIHYCYRYVKQHNLDFNNVKALKFVIMCLLREKTRLTDEWNRSQRKA